MSWFSWEFSHLGDRNHPRIAVLCTSFLKIGKIPYPSCSLGENTNKSHPAAIIGISAGWEWQEWGGDACGVTPGYLGLSCFKQRDPPPKNNSQKAEEFWDFGVCAVSESLPFKGKHNWMKKGEDFSSSNQLQ